MSALAQRLFSRRSAAAWQRPVFVLATGRSGSTLLLRLLNCMRDLTVWGEHGGVVRNLRELHETLTTGPFPEFIERLRPAAEDMLRKRTLVKRYWQSMTAEWANSFRNEDVEAALRECLVRLMTVELPTDRRWGFKEIRYGREDYEFLLRLFPRSQTVVLTRDPAAVLRSQFATFSGGDTGYLPRFLELLVSFFGFAAALPPRSTQCVRLDYSRLMSAGMTVASELESFFGSRLDGAAARVILQESQGRNEYSPYEQGGVSAVEEALAEQFVAAGLPVPTESVRRAARLYGELRRVT